MLETAVITEKVAACNMKTLMSKVSLSNILITGMKILSPNKLLLCFPSEIDLVAAEDESCVLWSLF